MPGLTDILHTSRDALAAQSYGLSVTGQNVANVNTPGYVRRSAVLQSQPLGSQSFGTVTVKGVDRLSDIYTEQRHYAAIGLSSSASESDRLLGYLEAQFDVTTGLDVGTALSELHASFSTLSTDPNNPATRSQVLGKAQNFIGMINRAADDTAKFRTELLTEAHAVTKQVNTLTKQLADVTAKISNVEAVNQDASDLKDDRDRMLGELSNLVDVRTFTNNQGQLVVQGAGTTLVEGSNYRSLEMDLDSEGMFKVWATTPTGARSNVTNQVNGGKLAGIKETHDVHTTAVLKSLDQLAYDVATSINTQHQAGYGLDGSTGMSFFDVTSGLTGAAQAIKLHQDVAGQPNRLAASATATGIPGDGANAIALSQLSHLKVANGATETGSEAYGSLLADIGNRRKSAANDAQVREAITAQAYSMRESASGVNLDEEMVNLTKYQRAYEAASRVLTTADQLLEDLINSLGR